MRRSSFSRFDKGMTMNLRKAILIALTGLTAAVSCKSQYETLLSSNDVDTKYKAAMDYFNQKKYLKAAQLFESMTVLTSGTPPAGLPVPRHLPLGTGPDPDEDLPGRHRPVHPGVSRGQRAHRGLPENDGRPV